jgi:glycine/D-amino acid oxidase-like deaminating enzyme
MNEITVWNSGLDLKAFPRLAGQVNTDVLVVGGGITGLTAAYLLAKEGKRVVMAEALTIAQIAYSRSSGHLTTAFDYGYTELRSKYNLDTCLAVASSRKFAISFIHSLSQKFSCDFKYVSGYLYAEDKDDLEWLQKEKDTAEQSGLDVYCDYRTCSPKS